MYFADLIVIIQASIRDTLVLPNSESVGVSWMLGEKDDWVPRNAAPLMWLNREAPSDTSYEVSRDKRTEDRDLESKQVKQRKVDSVKQPINEDSGHIASSTTFSRSYSENNVPSQDLKVPLLQIDQARHMRIQRKQENPECQSPSTSRYVSLREESNNLEDDDLKPKKPVGRKARMFDLGKKMGEKLEEKRRHIEEKSRNIVEKMRGP